MANERKNTGGKKFQGRQSGEKRVRSGKPENGRGEGYTKTPAYNERRNPRDGDNTENRRFVKRDGDFTGPKPRFGDNADRPRNFNNDRGNEKRTYTKRGDDNRPADGYRGDRNANDRPVKRFGEGRSNFGDNNRPNKRFGEGRNEERNSRGGSDGYRNAGPKKYGEGRGNFGRNDRPNNRFGEGRNEERGTRGRFGAGDNNRNDRPNNRFGEGRNEERSTRSRFGGNDNNRNDRPNNRFGEGRNEERSPRSRFGGSDNNRNDRPNNRFGGEDNRNKKFGDKRENTGDSRRPPRPFSKSGNEETRDGEKRFSRGPENRKPGGYVRKTDTDKPRGGEKRYPAKTRNKDEVSSGRNFKGPRKNLRQAEDNMLKGQSLVEEQVRLNRYIANSGLCSRREADVFIQQGMVTINKQVVSDLGTKVNPGDVVTVDGRKITPEKPVYILLNKPKGYITTTTDPDERATVLDLIDLPGKERIYPVGRLDRNTSGVLLLTNDGELSQKLMHPSFEIKKIYKAKLDRKPSKDHMLAWVDGVELEDGFMAFEQIGFVAEEDDTTVGLEVHSGRNRIVRRMFEHFGYEVKSLDRAMLGEFDHVKLGRGKWRLLNDKEIQYVERLKRLKPKKK